MVPPPMAVRLAADLRPSADGPYSLGWDRQTDSGIAVSLNASYDESIITAIWAYSRLH